MEEKQWIFSSPLVLDELLARLDPEDLLLRVPLVCKAWLRSSRKEYVWFRMAKLQGLAGHAVASDECRRSALADENEYIPAPLDRAPSWRALVLRNVCVHLAGLAWARERQTRWAVLRHELVEARCGECRAMNCWMCLECETMACGRTQKKHMIQHNQTTGHAVVVATRELNVWCFKCDRYLGETRHHNARERHQVLLVQKALLINDFFSHRKLKQLLEEDLRMYE